MLIELAATFVSWLVGWLVGWSVGRMCFMLLMRSVHCKYRSLKVKSTSPVLFRKVHMPGLRSSGDSLDISRSFGY